MRKIYQCIKKINDGIRYSDKQTIIEGLESIRSDYHWARIPLTPFSDRFYRSIYEVVCYFLNELFENHTELFFDNYDFFSRYTDVMAKMEREWPMKEFRDLGLKYAIPEYYIGKMLSLTVSGDKSALNLLKHIEKAIPDQSISGLKANLHGPIPIYPMPRSLYPMTRYYYFIIDAAAEYGNTEILGYIADLLIKKNTCEVYSDILEECVWVLICALFKNGMYDKLDELYRETFDSDFKKMIGTYTKSYFETRESVRYIKLIVCRYYKKAENVNQILCGLIDELDLTEKLFNRDIDPRTVMENAYALSEMSYQTQDITFLFSFWTSLKSISVSYKCILKEKEIKSIFSKYDDLICKFIVPTSFLRLSVMDNNLYHTLIYDFIEKYSVDIFLDSDQKYPVDKHCNICAYSEEFMLPLLEKGKVRLNESPDKSEYVKTLIIERSEIFQALLKNLDPDIEELTKLIAVCVENRNYNAVNEIRKILAEKV